MLLLPSSCCSTTAIPWKWPIPRGLVSPPPWNPPVRSSVNCPVAHRWLWCSLAADQPRSLRHRRPTRRPSFGDCGNRSLALVPVIFPDRWNSPPPCSIPFRPCGVKSWCSPTTSRPTGKLWLPLPQPRCRNACRTVRSPSSWCSWRAHRPAPDPGRTTSPSTACSCRSTLSASAKNSRCRRVSEATRQSIRRPSPSLLRWTASPFPPCRRHSRLVELPKCCFGVAARLPAHTF